MISFIDVLITVVFLFLLAVPGYIFGKMKVLPESAGEVLSTLALYGCQSVLIVTSFQNCSFSKEIALNMLIVAGLSTALHILFFAILKLIFIKRATDDKIRLVKYLSVFSNCGFMGLPFLQSLFADSGMQSEILIYCAVVMAVFQVLNWTFGVYILTGDKKQVSAKKTFLNPVIIAVIVGLILFFVLQKPMVELAEEGTLSNKILTKFMSSLSYIANMVTPLSMIVIGLRLANVNAKQLFADKWAYVSVTVKLVVMPMVVIFCVAYLPIASTIKYTVFFLLSMPSATSAAMMAIKFGKDGDFASIGVLLSTMFCVLTLPPLYLFMNGVIGVPI